MKLKFLLAFALVAVMSVPAMASGVVNDPWSTVDTEDELNLYEIYNELYGTSYTSTLEMDAIRVNPDQIFESTGVAGAEFRARFAGQDQLFGYYTNPDAPFGDEVLVPLFNVDATNNRVVTDTTALTAFITDTPFGLYDTSGGFTAYSEEALNSDGEDHMVAYYAQDDGGNLLDGSDGGEIVFIVAFEDRPEFDFDYNDLVVEVVLPPGSDTRDPIPEPATAGLLVLGLAAAVARRRFRA